jgi:hypothetical protein
MFYDTEKEERIHRDVIGCKKLIVSMILGAKDDVEKAKLSVSPKLTWTHAYEWFFSNDFDAWCDLLNVDPQPYKDNIRRIVKTPKHKELVKKNKKKFEEFKKKMNNKLEALAKKKRDFQGGE